MEERTNVSIIGVDKITIIWDKKGMPLTLITFDLRQGNLRVNASGT